MIDECCTAETLSINRRCRYIHNKRLNWADSTPYWGESRQCPFISRHRLGFPTVMVLIVLSHVKYSTHSPPGSGLRNNREPNAPKLLFNE